MNESSTESESMSEALGAGGAIADGGSTQSSSESEGSGQTSSAGSDPVLQPIMPLDLPVKVRSWELTVYPRSHIRRWFGVTRPAKARM